MTTQKEKVKQHLKKHKSITSWDAIMKYKITRLSAYIYMLKDDGMKIISSNEKTKKGKRFTKYKIK